MTPAHGYVGRLLATVLLLAVVATAAVAETSPPETCSLRSEVDTFVASVKVRTERGVAGAYRALERSTQKLVVFKARMRSKVETWRAALSDQKASVMALTQEAATTLNAWKTVAAQSWAQVRASAAETLEHIADWMRAPSETHARDETRV
jgi:hypothetical protein